MAFSESEIIEHIRRGNGRLYARLVDRHKDKAMTLAMKMLKNRQDAEEASQDAFVRAYHGLKTFEGTAKFGTWLYRILYNVCLTRIAKRKDAAQMLEYDEDCGYAEDTAGHAPGFEQELERKEMLEILVDSIDRLPGKYATILSLFYFQELSHDEICEMTGLPVGTVKVQLHRARALLQQRLSKEFSTEKIPL